MVSEIRPKISLYERICARLACWAAPAQPWKDMGMTEAEFLDYWSAR